MGNGIGKLRHCFAGEVSRRHDIAVILGDPLHEGLGHSFCYVPDQTRFSSKVHSDYSTTTDATAATNFFQTTTFFHSISGASVSANVSTQTLSMALIDSYPYSNDRASTFESSDCFASLPLQPVPRSSFQSGSGASLTGSGPIERGFLSGPIERGFVSGPIDRGLYSCPIVDKDKIFDGKLQRSSSQNGVKEKSKKQNLIKFFKRVISSSISRGDKSFEGVKEVDLERNNEIVTVSSGSTLSSRMSSNNEGVVDDDDGEFSMKSQNLQWAQGKAGEDRVHIVVSEKHGWVFVGIYDGFNGPDAPDYLLTNLYTAVHKELKGLLWNDKFESTANSLSSNEASCLLDEINQYQMRNSDCLSTDKENHRLGNGELDLDENLKGKKKRNSKGVAKKWEESQKRWRCEWDRERLELERKLKEKLNLEESNGINHSDILKALSLALKKTEDSYLEIADFMAREKPELALMGSCVLVMLMKGEDVYVMNVGDSRAVLARKIEPNIGLGRARKDLERIKEETMHDLEAFDDGEFDKFDNLTSHQLTVDHSTYVEEEVLRIKKEHPDDDSAVMNDRVKGYLKVTRAFGAGFLKQPKWNDALLEMFRIDYVGTFPYITCFPALCHHRLSPRDKFLILSSDGLYQYFTNEEAVCEVESFIAAFPEGDPAQHLIEEVLFRAARKAGMDFHELLDIPQGERRRYHDDVSVIIISFEGRIWRSSV